MPVTSEPADGGQDCSEPQVGRSDATRRISHVVIPALMPALFYLIAATPVETLGCVTRGLLALSVALVSGLAAVGAAIKGAAGRMRADAWASWWVVSSAILIIPVVVLLILA